MENRQAKPFPSIFDPRIFCTVTIIVIQISVWAAIGAAGGGWDVATPPALARFGALVRPLVHDHHQYWRLLTAVFLHGSLSHLALNAIALYWFGTIVEMRLGRMRYLVLYLVSGLMGNVLSLMGGNPISMSVGASGAIFGVVASFVIEALHEAGRWDAVARRRSSRALFFMVGIMLAFGFLIPGIDTLAHLGGAATGACLGLVLSRSGSMAASKRRLIFGLWFVASVGLIAVAIQPPDSVRAHVRSAFYYEMLGRDPAEAGRRLERAVEMDPRATVTELDGLVRRYFDPKSYPRLTLDLLSQLGVYPEAVAWYRERAEKKPSAGVFRILITLLQQPGTADYGAALEYCAGGRDQFPDAWGWGLTEAQVHASFREYGEALAKLDELGTSSVALSADRWEIAALCHLRRQEWAKVEDATSRCLLSEWDEFPEELRHVADLPVKQWRYQALSELGRTSESLALRTELELRWRLMARRAVNQAVGDNNLAWFLATNGGDLDEAAESAGRSVESAPEGYNLDTLAWIEFLRGNYAKAWAAMKRSLEDPRSIQPGIYYHAAAILHALDRDDEARDYLKRALDEGLDFDEIEEAEALQEKLGTKHS